MSSNQAIKMMHSATKNSAVEDGKGPTKFTSCLSSRLSASSLRQSGLPGIISNSSSGGLSLKPEPPLVLDSNPLEWTVTQVAEFLESSDCGDGDLVTRLKTEVGRQFLDFKKAKRELKCNMTILNYIVRRSFEAEKHEDISKSTCHKSFQVSLLILFFKVMT